MMSAPIDTLPIYEKMALLSAQMLAAAQNANWDLLNLLETRSAAYLEQLQQSSGESGAAETEIDNSNAALRERKVAMIKKILADDRDIRTLTEPRLTELTKLIGNKSNERKILRAYGVSKEG
jgi:flagellar protein FliT